MRSRQVNDRRLRTGKDRPLPKLHGAVPIPGYYQMCGWCGKKQNFGHYRNMTVCMVCGN